MFEPEIAPTFQTLGRLVRDDGNYRLVGELLLLKSSYRVVGAVIVGRVVRAKPASSALVRDGQENRRDVLVVVLIELCAL